MSFDRSKWVAILTGIVSLLLGLAYLILVQVLDSRGEMVPAPIDLSMGILDPHVICIDILQSVGNDLVNLG
ncbi:MAG: hypothetical protein WA902_17035 [Thermosynechococcaceae cyanobacterium]